MRIARVPWGVLAGRAGGIRGMQRLSGLVWAALQPGTHSRAAPHMSLGCAVRVGLGARLPGSISAPPPAGRDTQLNT